jgi:tryptophan 2,3-dioxygenase
MALLPSSGFQSVQYRKIELRATSLLNLLDPRQRHEVPANASVADLFPRLYWKTGATELATGKKTLTLSKFEEVYENSLQELAKQMAEENLCAKIGRAWGWHQLTPSLTALLRQFDHQANVQWPLAHFKSAAKYLQQSPDVISATGGTNWQAYLPPKLQLVMFFPDLWSEAEKSNWGKSFTL